MAPVVTISATYGAAGSVIGPAVAERLGVPFLDRAIPEEVAERLGCSLEDVLEHDDRAPVGLGRLLAGLARLPSATLGSVDTVFIGATDAEGRLLYDQEFVEHTEHVITAVAAGGGVILGRAGAVVLADHPTALHVRLDGPRDRRLQQAAALREAGRSEELPSGAAPDAPRRPPTLRDLDANDRARSAYVRRFYRADPADPRHYQVVLDTTVIAHRTCVDIIERLARERAGEP
ncbi:cytidylate kinase-like family protein [Thermobifida cellulosilytica]|uniref:Cytidylate kinase n=1 Tax=Thermobifida cellulosilytica TB100 TaxID=665004 RepID=A0A147KG09_THECS|nr:cytidylate kinase-like family protein [Thermobifida cellulosilytica]KUP96200.1 cytidylate kinase [Thermobifida cellulosilytica TB100]